MDDVLAIALGYVLGSIPFAFLVSRRRGIDLRRVGSGNVGAANVLRTSGVATAIAAMCLDAGKGSIAVIVAHRLTGGSAAAVAAGLASILGHIHPVWLGFRGGKGVATAAGVFAVLAPLAVAVSGIVFIAVVSATRYVSLGSLSAAATLAVAAHVIDVPRAIAAGAALAAAVVVYQHRSNLSRLAAGTERRVGQRT